MHPCTPKPMVAISRLVSTHLWLHSGHCSCEHRSSQLRRAALRNSVCCELYACWQLLVVVRSDCGCDGLLVLARRPSLNTPWPCLCSGHSEPASVATTARRIELRGRLRATRCCGWKYLLFVRRNEGLHPSGLCKATGASGCARQPTRNAKKKKKKSVPGRPRHRRRYLLPSEKLRTLYQLTAQSPDDTAVEYTQNPVTSTP